MQSILEKGTLQGNFCMSEIQPKQHCEELLGTATCVHLCRKKVAAFQLDLESHSQQEHEGFE